MSKNCYIAKSNLIKTVHYVKANAADDTQSSWEMAVTLKTLNTANNHHGKVVNFLCNVLGFMKWQEIDVNTDSVASVYCKYLQISFRLRINT